MIFSSLEFLCIFLPIVFIVYCAVPKLAVRNAILIVASLLFYAYGEPVYVILMLGSVVVNYAVARLIAAFPKRKGALLAVGVVLNLGCLGVFKYLGFIVTNLNAVLPIDIPVPALTLPLGISFFTFQAMSYIIDVYRGEVDAQKNFFYVLLYISFFPQLIAGPIVKYKDICAQINDRHQDVDAITQGICRFLFGLGKKVLIANTMGLVADTIFAADTASINAPVAWIAAIAYMMQIYFDFSGYSDMAIGLGRMFGFRFKENFIYPYGATGIKEFWRRWHISLSSWFKDYLYIPLGGNRKGRARAALNRIIVFFLCGLWHGASWTFVLWGLWHGLFLLLEEYIPRLGKLPRVIRNIYALLVVCLGFVLFRADNLQQAGMMITKMFTGWNFTAANVSFLWQQLTPFFLLMLVVAVIACAPLRPVADRIRAKVADGCAWLRICVCASSVLVLVLCLVRLSANTYNPFIYFRF